MVIRDCETLVSKFDSRCCLFEDFAQEQLRRNKTSFRLLNLVSKFGPRLARFYLFRARDFTSKKFRAPRL